MSKTITITILCLHMMMICTGIATFSVSAVISFPPSHVRPPRESYKSLLLYWPIEWAIHFHLDIHEQQIERCLEQTDSVPIVTTESKFVGHSTEGHISPSGITEFGRNHWKFFLDEYVEEDIIAIIDDDACLLAKMDIEDIVNERKQLVTRSIAPSVPFGQFIKQELGWDFLGTFMTDFPVFIWRDMLPDVRKAIIDASPHETFTHAFDWLIEHSNKKHRLSEFAILLNFAYSSPKWRDKYQWQVFNTTDPASSPFIFGMSLHQHKDGKCWNSISDVSIPEHLYVYPNNLEYRYNAETNKFVPRKWGGDILFYESSRHIPPPEEFMLKRRNMSVMSRADIYPHIVHDWAKCFERIK